ncbi:MAG: YggU family protein [Chloroflexi bacterium]|nr:YggU family protein [Chloroflexota bacterium]
MTQNNIKVNVQVQPNARRNEVLGFEEGIWRIRVAAPPVAGKANSELIDFLSQLLGVSKGSITIEHGHTSRRKVIAIQGLDEAQIMKALGASTSSANGTWPEFIES